MDMARAWLAGLLPLDVGIIEDFWFKPVRSVEASADFSVYASLRATWGP